MGEKIKAEAFALDLPFTIAENDKVVSIYKDGRKEIIATIEPVERKLKGKKFTIPQ